MDLELRGNNCKIENPKRKNMRTSPYTIRAWFGCLMLGCVLFVSCQRSSGGSGNEDSTEQPTTEVVHPNTSNPNGFSTNSTISHNDTTTRKGEPIVGYGYKVSIQANGTFGYEITENGQTIFSQTTAAGLGGKGFPEKIHAAKAAELILEKLKNGVASPTLTEDEVKDILGK